MEGMELNNSREIFLQIKAERQSQFIEIIRIFIFLDGIF